MAINLGQTVYILHGSPLRTCEGIVKTIEQGTIGIKLQRSIVFENESNVFESIEEIEQHVKDAHAKSDAYLRSIGRMDENGKYIPRRLKDMLGSKEKDNGN